MKFVVVFFLANIACVFFHGSFMFESPVVYRYGLFLISTIGSLSKHDVDDCKNVI